MRSKARLGVGALLGVLISAAVTPLNRAGSKAADEPAKTTAAGETAADNKELAAIYEQDQADRMPLMHGDWPTDWWSTARFVARDLLRQARVLALYRANALRTGNDYYHAAMVFQHGYRPDDFLLAHELSIVALAKGHRRALWLAAATEDRFLMNIKRPQRFGTQYRAASVGAPMELYRVAAEVTDVLRREMMVPSLAEAKTQEAKFQEILGPNQ
jgi:hypothetical protein